MRNSVDARKRSYGHDRPSRTKQVDGNVRAIGINRLLNSFGAPNASEKDSNLRNDIVVVRVKAGTGDLHADAKSQKWMSMCPVL